MWTGLNTSLFSYCAIYILCTQDRIFVPTTATGDYPHSLGPYNGTSLLKWRAITSRTFVVNMTWTKPVAKHKDYSPGPNYNLRWVFRLSNILTYPLVSRPIWYILLVMLTSCRLVIFQSSKWTKEHIAIKPPCTRDGAAQNVAHHISATSCSQNFLNPCFLFSSNGHVK